MIYSQGHPCFYGAIGCGYIVNSKTNNLVKIIKIGTSYHIANRKSGYSTAWPSKPIYNFVIVLDKDSIIPSDLYKLDAEFLSYIKSKNLEVYHIEEDGGKEFYDTTCSTPYLTLLSEFIAFKKLSIVTIILDDPFPIRDLTTNEKDILDYEDKQIKLVKESIVTLEEELPEIQVAMENTVISLKQKFFNLSLGNKLPRRVQNELWDIFEKICDDDEVLAKRYSGIVQWPTGVGKTIAILILIILACERCKRKNTIYRCLMITWKNDIWDTINQEKKFNDLLSFKEILSKFDIELLDGTHGKINDIKFPKDKHCVLLTLHQTIVVDERMESFLPITHFHYDEVHNITGEKLYNLLNTFLDKWKTLFLTGTSATPLTNNKTQQERIASLFGENYNIISRCEINEAVEEGWIAKPRFITLAISNEKTKDRGKFNEEFAKQVIEYAIKKKGITPLFGGKVIAYNEESRAEVAHAIEFAKEYIKKNKYNNIEIYSAIEITFKDIEGASEDEKKLINKEIKRDDAIFCKAPIDDGKIHILFACGRYKEGSDIPGLEMTASLMGNTMAAKNAIQVSGRGLRRDYPEKEGWYLICRPSEEGTTEQDILDKIILDIIDLVFKMNKTFTKKDFEKLVTNYMHNVDTDGNEISIKETVDRIQAAYVRREYIKKDSKEKYTMIRALNRELNLKSKVEYFQRANEHSRFIPEPETYFKHYWNSWYDFLGVDCALFPQNKDYWINICKERGFWKKSWPEAREKYFEYADLPQNPRELYDDYTNWDKEMEVEDDHVW